MSSSRVRMSDIPSKLVSTLRDDAEYLRSVAQYDTTSASKLLTETESDYSLYQLSKDENTLVDEEHSTILIDRDQVYNTATLMEDWADFHEQARHKIGNNVAKIGEKLPTDINDMAKGYTAIGGAGAGSYILGQQGTGDPELDTALMLGGTSASAFSLGMLGDHALHKLWDIRNSAGDTELLMENATYDVKFLDDEDYRTLDQYGLDELYVDKDQHRDELELEDHLAAE